MSSAIKQSVWPVDMDVAADLTSEPVEQRLWRDRSQVSVGHGELVVMKRLIIASVLALLVSGVTAEARGFGGGGFRGGGFHGARMGGYRGGFHGHRGALAGGYRGRVAGGYRGGYGRYGYRGGYGRYGYRPYAYGAAALGVGAAAAYGARSYGGCGPYHYYDPNSGGCSPY